MTPRNKFRLVRDGKGPLYFATQSARDAAGRRHAPAHGEKWTTGATLAAGWKRDAEFKAAAECDHADWSPECPVCCEPHAAVAVGHSDSPRRFLVFAFDVTDLTDEQVGGLGLHVQAQAEGVDDRDDDNNYPEVSARSSVVEVLP